MLIQDLCHPNLSVSVNGQLTEVNQLDIAYAITGSELSFKHDG